MSTAPPVIILPSGELAALGAPNPSRSTQCITLGLCLVLCFAILAFGAVEEWSSLTLHVLSAILFLGWVGQQIERKEALVAANPLYLPMLAFGAVVAVQVYFHVSAYPFATRTQAMHYVSYALLLFVASQTLRTRSEQRRFLVCMSAFSILLAAFSLLQFFGTNGKIYWLRLPQFGGIPFGPYVNHNHYAGVMELLAPMPLVMSLSRSYGNGQRILLAFGGSLMVASIFISGSRGGMLACIVQLLFLGYLLGKERAAKKITLAIACCLLLVVPLVYWLGSESLFDRMKSLQSPMQEKVTGYRQVIIKDGWHMFRDRPLLGWGLGTFPVVYPKYRSFYTNLFVNQAHNDYLQLLDETGLLGFGVGLWFLITLYRAGTRISLSSRRASVAALVGCTGIVVHSFTDFNLQIPANAALFFVLGGIATMNSDT